MFTEPENGKIKCGYNQIWGLLTSQNGDDDDLNGCVFLFCPLCDCIKKSTNMAINQAIQLSDHPSFSDKLFAFVPKVGDEKDPWVR
jgi:hypothetical protein